VRGAAAGRGVQLRANAGAGSTSRNWVSVSRRSLFVPPAAGCLPHAVVGPASGRDSSARAAAGCRSRKSRL